jgi:uncharacterized membrane protein YbhN (UPF0104 family)
MNTLLAILAGCIAALVVYWVGSEVLETVENGNLIAILLAVVAGVIAFLAVNRYDYVGRRRL